MKTKNIKKDLLDQLFDIRNNKTLWNKFKNSTIETAATYDDLNYQNRLEILIALQFHYDENDEELIKFLFEEEIKDRERDPFQGSTESLKRAGYLLATFKNPENVWLFLRAKNANFDTHIDFDSEYILSAGVSKTFDYIDNCNQKEKEDFYYFFPNEEECEITASNLMEWNRNKKEDFPKTPDDHDLEFWIDIALEICDIEEAKRLINIYENKLPIKEQSLRTLKYFKSRINDFDGQIEILKILTENPNSDRKQIFDYLDLSRVYLENNQPMEAWTTIQTTIKTCNLSNQYTKGLFAELAADIILYAKSIFNKNELKEIYDFAISNYGKFLSLTKLEKYFNCAKKMGDRDNQKFFLDQINREKRELEELKKRLDN